MPLCPKKPVTYHKPDGAVSSERVDDIHGIAVWPVQGVQYRGGNGNNVKCDKACPEASCHVLLLRDDASVEFRDIFCMCFVRYVNAVKLQKKQ